MKPYVNKTWQLALLGALLAASAGVQAAGTSVGTTVSNMAKLSYSVGGTAQNEICSSSAVGGNSTGNGGTSGTTCTSGTNGALNTSFLVDLKVNLNVAEANSLPTDVVPGTSAQVTTFTVTNLANSPLDFALAANQVANGGTVSLGSSYTDDFDSTGCNAYVESGATAGYQAAQDNADYIDELAADASKTVYVVCSVPGTQVNNDVAIVGLTATARGDMTGTNNTYAASPGSKGAALVASAGGDTANVDVVFADGTGSESGDGNNDAKYSARDAYRVQTAVLSVTKTVALLCDPVNGNTNPYNIPGAVVRWKLEIKNTGATSATLATVADTLNANTAFDPDLITGAGTCEFAAAGAGTPESTANGNGVRIQNTNARNMAGTAGGAAVSSYFTGAADADGVTVAGQNVSIDFATALPAGGSYTAGELKTGETVTVYFNVGVN